MIDLASLHWPTLAISDFVALAGMLGGALVAIFKFIQKIRTNDLQHLDIKIDLHHQTMAALVQDMKYTVERLDEKIDQHIRDHAMGEFTRHE